MAYGDGAYATAPYGAPGDPPEIAPPPAGLSLTLALRVTMVEAQDVSLPVRVTMAAQGTIAMPLRVSMVEAQDVSLPVRVTMVEPLTASPALWRPVVTLGGVDVSERLTGEIEVEAVEGEARIARFSLAPAPGVILLPQWSGQPVTIDSAELAADGSALNPRRLFTGVVDVPDYDVTAHVVTFECTDQLQEVIGNLPREWVDEYAGGEYSPAVSGVPADTKQYAAARLASVPASLDLDPYQQPRVTFWHSEDAPARVFAEADVVDGSLRLQLASRADLRNEVSTGLDYRLPRLRGRVIEAQFERTINQYTSQGLDIPSRAMIEQALSSLSGWERIGDINYVAVDPGVYESVGGSGVIFTEVRATDAPNLALGFAAAFASRWVQSVTEQYRLTVRAQASIDAIGYARDSLDSATLDAEFDDAAWLDGNAGPALTLPPVGDVSLDYGAAGATDRAAAQQAVRALVEQAKVAVLASHRTTRVGATLAHWADVDLHERYEIDTGPLRATGKAARVVHRLNMENGSAVTEIEVAVSGCAAVGLQADDPADPPTAPADPTPAPGAAQLACACDLYVGQTMTSPPYDEAVMIGFTTNARAGATFDALAPAYPLALTVGAPEVEAAVRDPIALPQTATYSVAIPQDTLEINVP